jgi:serine/threonine-protein kinase RsbW
MDDVILTIPADAGYVHLLRTVAAGVGASMDLSFDEIEDLRLAVAESAGYLLASYGSGSTITMRLQPNATGITVRITRDGSTARPEAEAVGESTFAWQVLAALTDELQITSYGSAFGVEFIKRPRADRSIG